jgi:hypothetical protein
VNDLLLPKGHHWDLHIEHQLAPDNAGAFTGGGWKFLIHITVSPWGAIDSMVNVLNAKRAQPHLVLGGRKGVQHPVLVQMLPFDVAGRALQNNMSDGYQTNRANVIQIEICASPGRTYRNLDALGTTPEGLGAWPYGTDLFTLDGYYLHHRAESLVAGLHEQGVPGARVPPVELCMRELEDDDPNAESMRAVAASFQSGVASWGADTYKALGNVFELVRHRVPVPNREARSFQNTRRFTDAEFVKAAGLCGHMHGPDDDHIDPTTDFRGDKMVKYTKTAPNNL